MLHSVIFLSNNTRAHHHGVSVSIYEHWGGGGGAVRCTLGARCVPFLAHFPPMPIFDSLPALPHPISKQNNP